MALVYPYRSRLRWLVFGRYAHLVRAVNRRTNSVQDSTLDRRVESLRAWNLVRFAVSILLTIGVLATVFSGLARWVPGGADDAFVEQAIAISTALTGILTLAYLFLTRLLGQLEIDILMLLALEHRKT